MANQIFTWIPIDKGASEELEPNILVTRFELGKEQRRVKGAARIGRINHNFEVFPAQFLAIKDFYLNRMDDGEWFWLPSYHYESTISATSSGTTVNVGDATQFASSATGYPNKRKSNVFLAKVGANEVVTIASTATGILNLTSALSTSYTTTDYLMIAYKCFFSENDNPSFKTDFYSRKYSGNIYAFKLVFREILY